jgi:hypothetical protein
MLPMTPLDPLTIYLLPMLLLATGGKLPPALRLYCDLRLMIVSIALAAPYKIGFIYLFIIYQILTFRGISV